MNYARKLAINRAFLLVEDVDLIQKIVGSLEDPNVIDLGAGSGTTALAVKEIHPFSRMTTIDISEDNIHWAGLALKQANLEEEWFGIVADAAEAAQLFEDDVVDFIMLDTSHQLEPTRKELRAWLPKLKSTGYIWCHDYVGEQGVTTAIDELVEQKVLETIEVAGLGWVGRKCVV